MLRKMVKEDLPQLLVIEQSSQGAPWNAETFKSCIAQAFEGWVFVMDERIIGYIVLGMQAEECHILNLCIAREHQRKGYGHMLLEHGLHEARKRQISIAYLEVRRTNSRAIALYTRHNFHQIGERRDYYQTVGGSEDALVFAVSLK